MKIILVKDVQGVGKTGEQKDVKDGFGRNFLLAKGLAVLPGDPRAKEIFKNKEKILQEQQKKVTDTEEIAKAIDGKEIVFKVKTDEKGKLYGSVGPKEISDKLNIDQNLIDEHFKKTGEYFLEIKFNPKNIAKIKIVIEKEK